jgi:serine/threonine protein phosphatase PrpC
MELTDAGRSERGPRSQNQDCLFRDHTLGLFVVADGMGGHKAGEVASRVAVDAVVEFVRVTAASSELTWPYPFDPRLSVGANRLIVAMRVANRKVHEGGRGDPQLSGMGTTLVGALLEGDRIVIAHVGDSRAYRFRAGELEQITQDHTWVAAMLAADANARTEDHPMRHVLTSGIGMREDVMPTVTERPLASGDQWLLCSDGVHGPLDESGLKAALSKPSADEAAGEVVRAALAAGGTDNATAIVLRFV